jgi:CBS domain-containing protein/ribosome-associated translation inhibitor RaiA
LVRVLDLAVDPLFVAKPGDTVGAVVSGMRNAMVWVVPVINESGRLVGVVSYRDLLERRVGLRSRVSSVMSPPYSINADADVARGIEKMLMLRSRAIPVIDDHANLRGILTREALLDYLLRNSHLPRSSVSSIMSKPPITIEGDEAVARAKWLMIRHGVSRLPVLNSGRLHGIVSMRDIVERLYYATIPTRPRRGDVSGREDEILAAPVKSIATTPVVTVDADTAVEEVTRVMLQRRISGMPVLSGNSIVGVVSSYDVMRSALRRGEIVPIGGRLIELDEVTRASIERILSNYMARLSRLTNIIDFRIVMKQYEKGGGEKRMKYSVHVALKDHVTTYAVNEIDWDPVNAVRNALDTLVKRIERSMGRIRETRRRTRMRGGLPGEE